MKKLIPFLACLMIAAPAWSLSCLRPDIVRTFEMARDADEGFWIVRGRILADGPVSAPKPDASGNYGDNASATTPGRFVGVGLRPGGRYDDFARDIDLTVVCFAHWCGSASLNTDVFAAIEVKDTGPELVIDPCSSRVVPFSEEGEKRLLTCVRNGVCQRQ